MQVPQSTFIKLCMKDYVGEARLIFTAMAQAVFRLNSGTETCVFEEVKHRKGAISVLKFERVPIEISPDQMPRSSIPISVGRINFSAESGPLRDRLAELQKQAAEIDAQAERESNRRWTIAAVVVVVLGITAALLTLHL